MINKRFHDKKAITMLLRFRLVCPQTKSLRGSVLWMTRPLKTGPLDDMSLGRLIPWTLLPLVNQHLANGCCYIMVDPNTPAPDRRNWLI